MSAKESVGLHDPDLILNSNPPKEDSLFVLNPSSTANVKLSLFLIDPVKDQVKEKVESANKRGVIPIIVSSQPDEKNVTDYLLSSSVNHLIGMSDHIHDELEHIALKYLNKDSFGLTHHFEDAAHIDTIEIYHSKDAGPSITQLIDNLDLKDYFNTPKDYLTVMANELVTNAFYHMHDAPTQERKESIFLTPPQGVSFSIGLNPKQIAISVTDKSGTLDRDKLIKSLNRSFREKVPNQRTPGAGLGLYLVYQHANQLIINSLPDQKTEIIAIIEASKRYLHYRQRITSFHFFKQGHL